MKLGKGQRRLALDTVSYFTPYADLFWERGYRTVFRYLNYHKSFRETPCTDPDDWFKSASIQEIEELLEKGWDVGLVQRGIGKRNKGGSDAGMAVAEAAVYNARGLGVPEGVSVYCDCEWSESHNPTKELQEAYIEAWGLIAKQGKIWPSLYVSPDLKLTSAELWDLSNIHGYWKSASSVPAVDVRGYQINQSLEQFMQLSDGHIRRWADECYKYKGLRFDADMMSIDGRGDRVRVISA